MRKWRLIVIWSIMGIMMTGVLACSGTSSAHKPIYDSGGTSLETAMKIPDALVSYAIFAQFSPGSPQIQYYEFYVEEGQLFNFQLGVPEIDWLEEFAPVAFLFGPGLPAPDPYTSELLSEFGVALGSGDGAISWVYEGSENIAEFEPFTQTTFWERQNVEMNMPGSGTYYLAVAVPTGDGYFDAEGKGKYMLAPGKTEAFGVLDFMALPVDWVKSQLFWEENLIVVMLPTFLTVIIGLAVLWWYLRKRDKVKQLSGPARTAMYAGILGGLLMVGTSLNQAVLVGAHYSESSLNWVVLMLQFFGMLIGVLAITITLRLVSPRGLKWIIVPIILVLAALMIGAGFIVGPVIFLAACVLQIVFSRKPSKTAAPAAP